jgi:hypothetical protein
MIRAHAARVHLPRKSVPAFYAASNAAQLRKISTIAISRPRLSMSYGGASPARSNRCAPPATSAPVVFQYAPWLVYGEESFDHVERCAEMLRDDLMAVEFRNKSWFNERCR